jgi:hypothetical protein
MSTAVCAIQHIRRLRGGSQAHLLSASDGSYYVTKFQNNPQHLRVLANEMFAGRLGKSLGLPVAEVEVIDVGAALVDRTPDLCIDVGGTRLPCSSGRQVASRYVSDPERRMVFDFLPENFLTNVTNLGDFARVLVLDKWAANSDGRQAVFALNPVRLPRYAATFVDHGYCFNGGEWTFSDLPLLGTYGSKLVYQSVTGWQSFEPTLSLAERMSADQNLALCR